MADRVWLVEFVQTRRREFYVRGATGEAAWEDAKELACSLGDDEFDDYFDDVRIHGSADEVPPNSKLDVWSGGPDGDWEPKPHAGLRKAKAVLDEQVLREQ